VSRFLPDELGVHPEDQTPERVRESRRESRQAEGKRERKVPITDIAELDRLIGELSTARIVPTPNPESIAPVEMEDEIEDVVSETLARIYAAQNQFDDAARVYDLLAVQQPQRAGEFERKAKELRQRARAS
jgi:hypothetical protein